MALEKKSRGNSLENFNVENNLVIANTLFQQTRRRVYTRMSQDGNKRNQPYFILVKQK